MKPWLGGDIPLSEYAPAGSEELGMYVSRDMGKRGGCLLSNHGVVRVGESLDLSYVRASYIKDAAKIYHLALTVGKPYCLV